MRTELLIYKELYSSDTKGSIETSFDITLEQFYDMIYADLSNTDTVINYICDGYYNYGLGVDNLYYEITREDLGMIYRKACINDNQELKGKIMTLILGSNKIYEDING